MNGKANPYPVGADDNLLYVYSGNVVLGKYINSSGNPTTALSNFYVDTFIPVEPNTRYTFSMTSPCYYGSVMEYGTGGTFIRRTLFTNGSPQPTNTCMQFTTSSETYYIKVGSNPSGSNVSLEDVLSHKYEIVLGSTTSPQYKNPQNICPITQWTGVTLLIDNDEDSEYTAELPSSMYGAIVDLARGEATSTYNSKQGTSGWEMVQEGQFRCVVNAYDNGDDTSTNVADLYSTHYKTVSNVSAVSGTPYTCGLATIDHTTYLYVNDPHYLTLASFQTYIGEVQFVFKAHIPMSDTIEPQIILVPEGTNHVSATATSVNSVGTCVVGEAVVG